jgi:hypothetical protein
MMALHSWLSPNGPTFSGRAGTGRILESRGPRRPPGPLQRLVMRHVTDRDPAHVAVPGCPLPNRAAPRPAVYRSANLATFGSSTTLSTFHTPFLSAN